MYWHIHRHTEGGLDSYRVPLPCRFSGCSAQLVPSIPTLWVTSWPSVPPQVTQTRKCVHEVYSRHHRILCWLDERKRKTERNKKAEELASNLRISCSVMLPCSTEAILFISSVEPWVSTDSLSIQGVALLPVGEQRPTVGSFSWSAHHNMTPGRRAVGIGDLWFWLLAGVWQSHTQRPLM